MSEPSAPHFFRERFGVDDRSLVRALDTALERRVDYADLFFEYTTRDSVSLEESLVKGGSLQVEQGVGVRAQAGERQGYAHADDVSLESVLLAAATARAICEESGAGRSVAVRPAAPAANLYPVARPPTDVPIDAKARLLGEIDSHARALDPRVKQVMASIVSEHRQLLVAASDGRTVADVRPLVRLNVQV